MTPVIANLSDQVWNVLIKPIEKRFFTLKKIVVIGGGTMGLDIAQVFARNGYDVVVRDIKDEIIQASEARLNKGLDKLVSKGKLDEAKKAEILSHMSFTTELAAAADADLVVEAAIENLDIKKSIFAELDSLCKPETILASNTSSISITAIAAATKRADKFIGMHFFNPATVMKLVEVIRGAHTSDETYKTIAELAAAIGKEPVEVNEAPGFVVNKILIPYCNEGVCVLQEGVASAEDIDIAMQLGCNHPMGPLHLGDLIGWDVVLNIMDVLFNETHDSKYRANVLIRKMVRAGKLGIKSGEGFFNYKK